MGCSQVQAAVSWVGPVAVPEARLPASMNSGASAPAQAGPAGVAKFGLVAVDDCLVHDGAAEVHRKSLANPLGGQMDVGGHYGAHAGSRVHDPASEGSELVLTAEASA